MEAKVGGAFFFPPILCFPLCRLRRRSGSEGKSRVSWKDGKVVFFFLYFPFIASLTNIMWYTLQTAYSLRKRKFPLQDLECLPPSALNYHDDDAM